jgi:hypothetical protein
MFAARQCTAIEALAHQLPKPAKQSKNTDAANVTPSRRA